MDSTKTTIRILPAYHFKAQTLGDTAIEEYVNDILIAIEDDISQAIENEKVHTRTELPTTYSVPGMTNARAQRHIYYHVLKALRKSRYIPRIEIKQMRAEDQRVFVHTTWLSKRDREMEQYMDKYISAHQIGRQVVAGPMLGINATPISRRRRELKK